MECFQLYHYGLFGRELINAVLENVSAVYRDSVVYDSVEVCVNKLYELAVALNEILFETPSEFKHNCFKLLPNDFSVLRRISFINPHNVSTIVEYVKILLVNKAFNRLRDEVTAPAIMRPELGDYVKQGYLNIPRTTTSFLKKTNILNLGLAVAGSMLTYVASIRDREHVYRYYFFPSKHLDISELNKMKIELMNSITKCFREQRIHEIDKLFQNITSKYINKQVTGYVSILAFTPTKALYITRYTITKQYEKTTEPIIEQELKIAKGGRFDACF